MGSTFFLDSFFTTSSLRGSGAVLAAAMTFASGAALPSAATSTGRASPAFTADERTASPVPICSCSFSLAAGVVARLVLLPGIDFDLAMIGYSLHSPKFRNVLSCSANHIYLVSKTPKRTVEILLRKLTQV